MKEKKVEKIEYCNVLNVDMKSKHQINEDVKLYVNNAEPFLKETQMEIKIIGKTFESLPRDAEYNR